MTPEQLGEIEQQTKTMRGPWFVADCEGELQIWRESALRSIDRDDTGEVTGYQLPGHYRAIDLIAGWDLDTWDPGDDEDDDRRRQVAEWIGSAPQAILALVAEVKRLTAERDSLKGLLCGSQTELRDAVAAWGKAERERDEARGALDRARELRARCEQGARDNGEYYNNRIGEPAKYELGKAAVYDHVATELREILDGGGT